MWSWGSARATFDRSSSVRPWAPPGARRRTAGQRPHDRAGDPGPRAPRRRPSGGGRRERPEPRHLDGLTRPTHGCRDGRRRSDDCRPARRCPARPPGPVRPRRRRLAHTSPRGGAARSRPAGRRRRRAARGGHDSGWRSSAHLTARHRPRPHRDRPAAVPPPGHPPARVSVVPLRAPTQPSHPDAGSSSVSASSNASRSPSLSPRPRAAHDVVKTTLPKTSPSTIRAKPSRASASGMHRVDDRRDAPCR